MKRATVCSVAVTVWFGAIGVADAEVLMDQLASPVSANPGVNQLFTDTNTLNAFAIDDFTTYASYNLTQASVILEGTYNPVAFQVSIWRSIGDALNSDVMIQGTVVQQLVSASSVTTTNLGMSGANNPIIRADIPINLDLTQAGSYFLGIAPVQARLGDGNGQLWIMSGTGTSGGENARWINPSNVWTLGQNVAMNANAALRMEATRTSDYVPAPSSLALFILGGVPLGISLVRTRRKIS